MFSQFDKIQSKLLIDLIKLTKGKLTQEISTIQIRHRHSLNMSFESVTKSDEAWLVQAEDGSRSYRAALNEQR